MNEQPTYDLFVSYADADSAWVEGFLLPELGLPEERLMTKEEFRLGADKVDEFVRAVTSSRYTVLVFSPAFLTDVWTTFSRQIANYLSVEEQSNRLIPLLLRPGTPSLSVKSRVALECLDEDGWKNEVARLRVLLDQPEPAAEQIDCPYPGMVPFRDARFFCGREEEIEELARRLRHQDYLFVIGPSGSGKSSLIFAGLLPLLKRRQPDMWRMLDIRPGKAPFAKLTETLAIADTSEQVNWQAAVEGLLAPIAPHRLLLVIDQFEEVFAQASKGEQSAFLTAIHALRAVQACRLLLVMRADFYPDLMISDLWPVQMVERVEIAPLNGDALRDAIAQPAQRQGIYLETGLLERLLADAAEEPGVLPLMQETMVLLWEQRVRRLLPLTAYERLSASGSSGLAVAVATKADATLSNLSETQQTMTRRIFLRLIQFGEGRADTRRQQLATELKASEDDPTRFEQTLYHLADNRLLTLTGEEGDTERRVDLAHEVLIEGWPTLRKWTIERREAEQLRRRLEAKAKEWVRLGQGNGGLLDDIGLGEAERWLKSPDAKELGYSDKLVALVEVSRAAQEEALAQQQRTARFRTRALGAIAVLFFAALAIFAVGQSQVADERTKAAATAEVLAENEAIARANAEDAAGRESEARATAELAAAQEAIARANAEDARGTALAETDRAESAATQEAIARANAEDARGTALAETNRAESAATKEAVARADAEDARGTAVAETDRAESAATKEAVARAAAELAATQEAIAREDAEEQARIAQSQARASKALLALANGRDDRALLLALAAAYEIESDPPITQRALRNGVDQTLIRRTFRGHTERVLSAAFNLDGQLLLTGSDDATARLWNAQTGELLHVLEGHTDKLSSVGFSPNGKLLLTSSYDGTTRLWNAQTGQLLRALEEYKHRVSSVAFSPDSKLLLTGSSDRTARLWNAQTGQLLRTLRGHTDRVSSVAFSSDGKQILTGSGRSYRDGTAHLWNAQTGELLHTLEGHTSLVSSVAFSPDSKQILTGSLDRTARLWNAQTGQQLHVLEGQTYVAGIVVAFSPDGQQILTGSADRTIRLWNAQTGQLLLLHALEGHTYATGQVIAFSRDSKQMLTGGNGDGTIRLWETQMGQLLHTLEGHTESVESVTFSRDGQLLLTGSYDGTARLWNAQTGQLLHMLEGHTKQVFPVAFSRDGQQILTGGFDGTARLWNTRTGQQLHALEGHENHVWSVAFSPDGQLLLTGSWDGKARLWNAQTGQLLRVLEEHTQVWSVAFSPDGEQMLTAGNDATVRLWNTQTGELLHTLEGHTKTVWPVAFSPDGPRLLTGSYDGTARLWNTQTGELLHALEEHGGTVSSVAFSPDGQQMLTGSWDKTARLWNTQTGQLLHVLEGHTQTVYSVAFSPDGQRLLTGSRDKTARLWDIHTGQLIHSLEGHTGDLWSAAFSPDGTQVLTGSADGTARLWLVDDALIMAKLMERVCHVLTDETIRTEVPEWRGCEAELDAVAEELAEYERVWGEKE